MRPNRAGRPRLGRTARWKLATTSSPRMPSSHVQLLIPCGAVRCHRGCALSPRPDGPCSCRRRIDRMLATDPKCRTARTSAKCSGATSKPSRPVPRSCQPRIGSPRESARIFSPATSAQPIDHQPELHARTEFLYPTPQVSDPNEPSKRAARHFRQFGSKMTWRAREQSGVSHRTPLRSESAKSWG